MHLSKKFLFITFISVTSLTLSGSGLVLAQTTTSSSTSSTQSTTINTATGADQPPGNLVTAVPITEEDLGVPKPTRWEFIKRRIARAFTFSQVKKLRLDNERAKLLLVQARITLQQGNTDNATQLVEQYNRTMSQVVQETSALSGQAVTQNPQAEALISQITEQKILEASVLDALSLKATGQFNRKVTDAKLKALKDLAKLLEKENLPPEKLEEKLTKISEKLERNTTKAAEKYAKRLQVIEELDKISEDPELEKAIEQKEDETLNEIAKKHKDNLGAIVKEIEGNVAKHIAVLEKLLQRVPDEAKPAVQEAVNRSQERLVKQLEKIKDNQREIEEKIDEAVGEVKEHKAETEKKAIEARQKAEEAQKKALERLKERAKENGKLQQEIDKRTKKIEEEMKERATELDKKEQEEEQHKDTTIPTSGTPSSSTGGTTTSPTTGGSTSNGGTTTSTPTSSSSSGSSSGSSGSGSSGSTETIQPEPKTYEVKYKDGRFDTSDLPSGGIVANDSIKFKNNDDETIDIRSNPHPIHTSFTGLNLGTLTKGQEKTVKFTSAGTYGFHNHLIPSITGSVTVK